VARHSNCKEKAQKMQNPFKKIKTMLEKDTANTEPEVLENTPEPLDLSENKSESMPNGGTDHDKLKTLELQLEESRNKYIYLYSDFDNFRRNAARERIELISTAGRDIMTALLPVLDDFDRAEKNGALSEGVALIHQKLVNTLKNKGLNVMETQIGDEFNADKHEAIVEIPAPSEELKSKVVDIIERGYLLGEKQIRFAKVVVGK
jgi:molecular chaperone GrpE